MNFKFSRILYSIIVFASLAMLSSCQDSSVNSEEISANLEEGFITPPNEAKPLVWWHWMDGNVTKDGIRKDLEWMHRIGVGGFHNFDIGDFTQMVDERVVFMTPEWKDAFQFTTELADSLGLEMGIAASPGFSESGGPWVEPEQAMKKYVWSEIRVEGGKTFSGVLPHPPTTVGAFQNLEVVPGVNGNYFDHSKLPEYYADAAVIAYKVADSDYSMEELNPKVTSSEGSFNLKDLIDGDLVSTTNLPSAPAGESSWVQFEFDEPTTIQSITVVTGGGGRRGFGGGSSNTTLEVSNDGSSFTKVADISTGSASQTTLAFAPATGKYFRYAVKTPEPSQNQGGFGGPFGNFGMPQGGGGTAIAELVLNTGSHINRFEDKAAFAAVGGQQLAALATPEVSSAISKDNVIDLTAQMEEDGTLNWDVPEGKWVVMRLGYSLLGTTNHPASYAGTGFEVDKLDPGYVKDYFNKYLDLYEDASGGLMGETDFKYILNDSWEAGTQNWTDNMISEFKNRRGYDLIPWMPVLTGHVVESAEASDKVLWDFRRTLEEMLAEYHYDQLTEILNERGLARFTESHEGGRAFIGDGMEVKRNAEIPMSATWTPGGYGGVGTEIATRHKADVRESASVSHIYGKKMVAAESLTSSSNSFGWSPEGLKPTADAEFANGLNKFVIHASVHQPSDELAPGASLQMYGQMFTRHETWAEQAYVWTNYLARTSFMMQQGKNVADVAYMYGEENNITSLFGSELPNVPEGYEYDFVNADIVVNVLEASNGVISTPTGSEYKILALDASTSQMTLPVLQKIKSLVEEGAIVVGEKPQSTPSNSDDDLIFNDIVNELWANESGVNTVGSGNVYAGYSIQDVLTTEGIKPDFAYTKPLDDSQLLYVHHTLGDIEFYWVNNRNERFENSEVTFRIDGKQPEIWHADSGEIEEASYRIENGMTTVSLNLEPSDAVFVVFRKDATENSKTVSVPQENLLTTIEGSWIVNFQKDRGAPNEVTFDSLTPWNENKNEGIKYFSGTATYTKTIDVAEEWIAENNSIYIDLGEVANVAEVFVNGKSMGVAWKTPFKLNISDVLTAGENELEIKVTNLWVNRLVGDEQPGVTETYSYTGWNFFNENSSLVESGLLGPIKLLGIAQ